MAGQGELQHPEPAGVQVNGCGPEREERAHLQQGADLGRGAEQLHRGPQPPGGCRRGTGRALAG